MGLRLRLRAGVDIAGFPDQARVVLQAMRTYGLVVADNGTSGMIGGVPDPRWDNDALHQLGRVTVADLEAVDTAGLQVSPASAAARGVAGDGGATPGRTAARPAGPARRPATPALLPGVGRRAFADPAPMAAAGLPARPASAQVPAPTADRPSGPGPALGGLLPWVLGGLFGLVAAALVARVARRPRHPEPSGRHVRSATQRR
jgi:hypothetical protein